MFLKKNTKYDRAIRSKERSSAEYFEEEINRLRKTIVWANLLSPLVPLFWFFTRLSSDSNPIEEKKKTRRRPWRESCMNNWFPGREWKRGGGRVCVGYIADHREPLDGIKLVINANTSERGRERAGLPAEISRQDLFQLISTCSAINTLCYRLFSNRPSPNKWLTRSRNWRTRRNWSNRFHKATNFFSRKKEKRIFEYRWSLFPARLIKIMYVKYV